MRVPLETLQIGPWKYISEQYEDLELLYQLDSPDLFIRSDVSGSNGGLPATYRIRSISAANLSLLSVIPGSLETMVTKMVLETDNKITYQPIKNRPGENNPEDNASLQVKVVSMTASVHETGYLRDTLLHLNRDFQADININSPFLPPQSISNKQEENAEVSKPHLTFMEDLPFWVLYIPWMFYSKRTRYFIQYIIFLYSVISVLWAMWQLYRHVNLIQIVIQPIIVTLKTYFFPVFDFLDWSFSFFTLWWHTFLSPLNILRGLMLTPLLQILSYLKHLVYILYLPISHLVNNTGLITALKSVTSLLYTLWNSVGNIAFSLFRTIASPVKSIWQSILNSQIAVASMDFQRLRLSWVFNLIINSFKSIINGFAKFVGYKRKEQKIKKAMESSSTPMVSPVSSPSHPSSAARRRNDMPILYSSSPLTKR